jgi:hypothetical protein
MVGMDETVMVSIPRNTKLTRSFIADFESGWTKK